MTFRLTACPVAGCPRLHGVIHERKGPSPRTAPDLTRVPRTAESRVGRRPGRRAPSPVGTLPVSEGRKALSTTG